MLKFFGRFGAVAAVWLAVALMSSSPRAQQQPGDTAGEHDSITITVTDSSGQPICKSYSFSQFPRSPELFLGKLKTSNEKGRCKGPVTLALFHLDWNSHVMTMLHPVMQTPVQVGSRTIRSAYDPYLAEYNNETWVAFECAGPGIPGATACMAPVLGNGERIDLSRLSMPVVGIDSDPKSEFNYSASTPKLLNFKGHLYIYWSTIQGAKAPPRHWISVETRGAELELDPATRTMWVKGRNGRPAAAHTPGSNVSVMAPDAANPYSRTTVDTEGLYIVGNKILVISSVGGNPDGQSPCVKPMAKSTGCYRLEVTQTTRPLAERGFHEEVLLSPKLPANPVEYPRIVTDPGGQTYLMVIAHPMQGAPAPTSGKALAQGLLLIPFPIQSLRFGKEGSQ